MNDAQQKVDDYLAKQDDWKSEKLKAFRDLIHRLNPNVIEEWKWNVPVFTVDGKMRLSMAVFKDHVKYNFFIKDMEYQDPNSLFNNGFDSTHFRSIDLKENEKVDTKELEQLVSQFVK